jgi:lipopolysaccharide transport system permease protein
MTTSEMHASFSSSAARPGPIALLRQAVADIRSRRQLIGYLVRADAKKKGSDTLLGNIWWVLDPLLQMLVYVVLVSVILENSQPDYPLFIFAAILPWKWFVSSVGDAIGSITTQDRLIKQLKFPKIVLPTATTVAAILHFVFGLIPLGFLLVLLYRDRISGNLVFLPVIAAVQFLFTLAFAYVVAAVNVFYRDVENVSRHALRMWFYLSPALYGASAIDRIAKSHPTLIEVFKLNPFYVLFTSYRNVIYGSTTGAPTGPDWSGLLVLSGVSLVFLALATILFKRVEPAFAKVL